ncbi:hypothetical protein NDU88_001897 [Pleurodeles waltl]|uniref:Uncharacterized protein n=1 Tax=Pleurodeles waltl TaxID=8319 RepID=A0AAV7LZ01_PLEWA|nr:hypothetical protein NDU88_001897 [Pleurodeles waltl]
MAVTSAAVRTVTASVHRHWLLEPIGPSDNQCGVARRSSTTDRNGAQRQRNYLISTCLSSQIRQPPFQIPVPPSDRWIPVLLTQEGVPDHRCMLDNLAFRRQVHFLQKVEPGDCRVSAVEPVESDEEEAEEEDVDNRTTLIQQYFQ